MIDSSSAALRVRLFTSLAFCVIATAACTSSDGGAAGASTTTTSAGSGAGGSAGAGGAGSGGSASGGAGGGTSSLEELLAALRADRDGTLLAQSRASGWPAKVEGGYLVVSTDPAFAQVAGDHDGWTGAALASDEDFAWAVVALLPGDGYKLKGSAATYSADPWSRAYRYDDNGELSLVADNGTERFDRHFAVAHGTLAPRTVRVRVPQESSTHVLYVADGQNLFDPEAAWGGWHLDESAPANMMLVGIDNTAARMDEYTHVADDLGTGPVGGLASAYAELVEQAVRPLVAMHYGEPSKVGVMGSSLGGLVSLYLADRAPASYHFAASLSGTLGWGSIGADVHEETLLERLSAHGHQSFAIYLDSGGAGTCADSDADGIEDDGDDTDNYCVNKQLEAALVLAGYTYDEDFTHWHEPGASHDEAAWAARVFRPLAMFAGL